MSVIDSIDRILNLIEKMAQVDESLLNRVIALEKRVADLEKERGL